MNLGIAFAATVLISSASAHSKQAQPSPTVSIRDVKSLNSVIEFGSPDPKLKGLRTGDIWWRADVDVPPHVSIDHVQVLGYDPVILHLKDGRCFKIELDGGMKMLTSAQSTQIDCQAETSGESAWPPPKPRLGMRYVGRGWDLDAWTDERTGRTALIRANHQDDPPLLTTTMRVIGVGALGSPDAPMTEVTLVGYVGSQLTLATVMLYYS